MKQRNRPELFDRLKYLLALGIGGKFLVDTTVQLYNPFLTIIAAGIGINVVSMGRIVALRSLMGVSAPFLGSIADRIGHRLVIRWSLVLIGFGMVVAGLSGNAALFALAMVMTGVGHMGFTPNLHAYTSARLPYHRRAMGLGMIEYSWALAGIAGLSLSGQLIDLFSWRVPFFVLGALIVGAAIAYGTLPRTEPIRQSKSPDKSVSSAEVLRRVAGRKPGRSKVKGNAFLSFVDLGINSRSAWTCIALSGFCMFAMMHVTLIHGGWLEAEYGLRAGRLGGVALLFGVVDLSASFLVSVEVDRIGKRRSVMIGVIGMIIGFALLPLFNRSLPLAILGIGIPRGFFEFAIVSNFPLLSEQVPDRRGKVLSFGMTAGLLGTALAGLTGPASYLRFGVWGLGTVSTFASCVSLILLLLFVRDSPTGLKTG